MRNPDAATRFFEAALPSVENGDYAEWLNELRQPPGAPPTKTDFMEAYATAVLGSGMKYENAAEWVETLGKATEGWHPEQIVRHRNRFMRTALRVVNNEKKVRAIARTAELVEAAEDFASTVDPRKPERLLAWLQNLPWMGEANSRYVAIMLGIRDWVKPDRHLLSVARRFGYGADAQALCADVAARVREFPSTVDFVFWCASRETTRVEGTA